MHYALGQVVFSWHPPNSDSFFRLPDGETWFIIPENAFPLHQRPMEVNFTPLQPTLGIVHGDLRPVCGYLAMESHFTKLPTNSYCTDVASRGSLELCSECCNRGQTIYTSFSTRRSRSVSLCGLPLRGWSVVAPKCFHFTITAVRVDRGSSNGRNLTNWLVGKVASFEGFENHWALH